MSFLNCCTVDDLNSGRIGANGELNAKGPVLEIERVDDLPNEFREQNQKQKLVTLRQISPNWSFASTSSILKYNDLKSKWISVVEKDKDLEPFAKIPVRNFLLKNNGFYLGQVVEKDEDKLIYERQGIGHYSDGMGNYILGCWERDLPNKVCLAVSANGDYFLGEFVNGKRIYGEQYKSNEQRLFKGAFDDQELPYGAGEIIYDNERKYKGIVYKGLPHGLGTFTWPNGNYYEGQFMNGKQHGSGDLFVAKTTEVALNESGIQEGKTGKPGKLYKSTVWEDGVLKS